MTSRYRWRPKNTTLDFSNPKPWGTCDRCGFIWDLDRLQWQYDYRGSVALQNTRLVVCPSCLDVPQPQTAPMILSPDPPLLFNTRPEPYVLDETSWLATPEGDVLVTQEDETLITPIPNPDDTDEVAEVTTEDGDEIITEDGVPIVYEP